MGRSRLWWACGTVAPWCLAVGLLVSFTADAGQDVSPMGGRAERNAAATVPDDLIPTQRALFFSIAPLAPNLPNGAILRKASLAVGEPEDLRAQPDEIDPRVLLKRNAHVFPAIDRSHKGDPAVGLRPTFDAKWRAPGGLDALGTASLLLAPEDPNLPTAVFMPSEGDTAGPESVAAFEPWSANDSLTTQRSFGVASPHSAASALTARASGGGIPHNLDGATPVVPRAVALGSTTPAGADSTPIEIVVVAVPKIDRHTSVAARVAKPVERPDYASLIDTDKASREQRCLAEAIYFEARSEPEAGQAAVAQVVLNRVNSGLYPSTVCGVVYQNRNRHLACQFSFACEGRSLRISEPDSWRQAVRIAREVTDGKTYLADVGGSTHYHANYVRPFWAKRLKKMDRIGHHIFYELRPGQT